MEQFLKDGKQVELLTDVSGIDLNQPGVHQLGFLYKKKICSSSLQIVDTTASAGESVAHTIYK